jgi:uncharacterized protein YprB with RNaseH-like and TPR domain
MRRVRAHRSEELRRLLGIRERATGAAPRAAARTRRPRTAGVEIAEGLRWSSAIRAAPRRRCCRSIRWCRAANPAGEIDSARILHFDTETTGLAGGTGTRAFMIGAADWHDGGCACASCCARSCAPSARCSSASPPGWRRTACSAATTAAATTRRCWPRAIAWRAAEPARRAAPPRPAVPGAAALPRRLGKLPPGHRRARWLGILREDDLPGSEAPRAWLDYMRGGDARDLRRVLAHNDQDLRTLGALMLRCSSRTRSVDALA